MPRLSIRRSRQRNCHSWHGRRGPRCCRRDDRCRCAFRCYTWTRSDAHRCVAASRALFCNEYVNAWSSVHSAEASESLHTADLVINATSVGLKSGDDPLLIDVKRLPAGSLVMDMVFNAGLTPLLRAAQARGCFVMDGLAMLLYQGTLAFELWTGKDAPVEVMRDALGLKKDNL